MNDVLLFFKFYNPMTEEMQLVGRFWPIKAMKLSEMSGVLRGAVGLPPTTALAFYKEEQQCDPVVVSRRLDSK